MKKVAITQSNYIPWKGFFDSVNLVDVFVLYDDMQYTKRDWRNRNQIKTKEGVKWLTIPVEVSGKYLQKINETKISDPSWGNQHWSILLQTYGKLPGFAYYRSIIEEVYKRKYEMLSEVNYAFIKVICEILDIKTEIRWSNEFELVEGKTEKLVSICKQLKGNEYFTGAAARNYMDESQFLDNGIKVNYYDYNGYIEYNQIHPPFAHNVSILDVLFSEGDNAKNFMKTFSNER